MATRTVTRTASRYARRAVAAFREGAPYVQLALFFVALLVLAGKIGGGHA